jgi:hypothetical protein
VATLDRKEEAIFNAARAIEAPEARRLYVQHSCGDDPALRARVEALLRMYDQERSFLESPAAGLRAADLGGVRVDVSGHGAKSLDAHERPEHRGRLRLRQSLDRRDSHHVQGL